MGSSFRDFGDALALSLYRGYEDNRRERRLDARDERKYQRDLESDVKRMKVLGEAAMKLEVESRGRAKEFAEQIGATHGGFSGVSKFGVPKDRWLIPEEAAAIKRKEQSDELINQQRELQIQNLQTRNKIRNRELRDYVDSGMSPKEAEKRNKNKASRRKTRRKELLSLSKEIQREFPYEDEDGKIQERWIKEAGIEQSGFFDWGIPDDANPAAYMNFVKEETKKRLAARKEFLSEFDAQRNLSDYLGQDVSEGDEELFKSWSPKKKQAFLKSKGVL